MLEWPLSKREELTDAGEDVEKSGPCVLLVEMCTKHNQCRQYGKQEGGFSENSNREPPCDPAVPLLGIHLKEMKLLSQRDFYIL